jgi:hypothetical protein
MIGVFAKTEFRHRKFLDSFRCHDPAANSSKSCPKRMFPRKKEILVVDSASASP